MEFRSSILQPSQKIACQTTSSTTGVNQRDKKKKTKTKHKKTEQSYNLSLTVGGQEQIVVTQPPFE